MAFKFSASEGKISPEAGTITACYASERIDRDVEWIFEESDLTLVAHLNGKIDRLETYFDRKLVHIGPPSAGEIWIIPPSVSYSTFAQGTEAEYIEVKMPHAARGLSPLAGFYDPNLLRLMKSLSAFIGRTSDIDRLESSAVVQDMSDEVARISYSAPRSSARQIKLSAASRNAVFEFIRDQISAQITLEDLSQVAGETPLVSCGRFAMPSA